MTPAAWLLGMIGCFVLMLLQRTGTHWPLNKLRVWLVLMASWMLGMLAVENTGNPTPTALWLAIDFASAVFVLHLFRPVGFAQKLIGSLYTMMVVWHAVYAFSDQSHPELYTSFQIVIGWVQWGVLMMWSTGDVGKAIALRLGISRHIDIAANDFGANGR